MSMYMYMSLNQYNESIYESIYLNGNALELHYCLCTMFYFKDNGWRIFAITRTFYHVIDSVIFVGWLIIFYPGVTGCTRSQKINVASGQGIVFVDCYVRVCAG